MKQKNHIVWCYIWRHAKLVSSSFWTHPHFIRHLYTWLRRWTYYRFYYLRSYYVVHIQRHPFSILSERAAIKITWNCGYFGLYQRNVYVLMARANIECLFCDRHQFWLLYKNEVVRCLRRFVSFSINIRYNKITRWRTSATYYWWRECYKQWFH